MRILILNPNQIGRFNWGHQLFKNAFSQQHEVVYYGKGFAGYNKTIQMPKLLEKMKRKSKKDFDLILTYESKWSRVFEGLENIDIPKAHIVIDYVKPRRGFNGFSVWPNVNKHLRKIKPNIIFARTIRDVEDLKRNLDFEKVFFLPFSVETSIYRDMNLNRHIDTMASFSNRKDVYPLRKRIQTMLNGMPIQSFTNRVTNNKYVNKLNHSKIFVNSGSVYKRLTMKFSEVLSCGTLLITEEAEDMKVAGFKNGKHLVVFKGLADLKTKVNYYLNHEKEREKIASKGMRFVHSYHSNDIRVKQFTNTIKGELKI